MRTSLKRKMVALCLMVAVCILISACGSGGINGTYVSQGLISQTFTFDGDEVTMSAFGINAPGTYTIEDGQIKIKYTLLGQEYEWAQSFSGSGDTINIGGTEFKKQ